MVDVTAEVKQGILTGTVTALLSDRGDAGRTIEETNLNGYILAVPSVRELRFPGRTRLVQDLRIDVLSGRLFPPRTESGEAGTPTPGVPMTARDQPNANPSGPVQWRLEFHLDGVTKQPAPRVIEIPAGGEIDISVAIPVEPEAAVTVVVSEEARLASEAAASAASVSQTQAASSAALAVQAKDETLDLVTANLPDIITAAEDRAETIANQRFDTELDAATAALLADPASDVREPVDALLAGKANTAHAHTAADVTGGVFNAARIPAASETAAGGVELATVTEATTGTDTSRAVTPAGLKAVADTKAAASHTHTTAQVTGLDTALAGKAATSHTHTTAQVTGLDTALAGKADTTHTHTTAQVTGLDAALADTGVVSLSSYIIGGTGSMTGRKVGKVVELVGSAISVNVATGTVAEFLNALPPEWRPPADRRGAAYFSSAGAGDGVVTIRSVGTGYFVQTSGTSRTVASFSISWLA